MLLCNWVKVIYVGNSATIKRDEYDFTLINFNFFIPISNASFVFPIHIEQVFFFSRSQGKGMEGGFTKRSTMETCDWKC